ncbi:MAG: nucleotidyltransferase domain-containing protein, partial [Planctomycetaceae bacterium]|nr:nucleotidyltransferase domain-containing protein [Planctomycetaceae bacterium]
MDAKIQNELDVISDIIVKTVPVDQIYLFGSYAYGTPNEDSDLDIYVVLK